MYKLLLCLRYLRTRYIALVCVVSVTLGVATMIVVNSVMAGFATEMRHRIQGLLSDIILECTSMNGVGEVDALLAEIDRVAGDKIAGTSATVEIYGMLSFQYGPNWIPRPVTLIGIDPGTKSQVGPLAEYLQSYQAVREDGKVVKGAERELSVPPGWELTPATAEYRRERAERRRWLEEQLEKEKQDHQGLNGAPASSAADDPFATADGPAVPAKAVIGELLPGRVYIGAGLVTFPYDDPETGKLETMYMVRPGDDVKISTINSGRPPEPAHFNATVVDLFRSGMSEYDSNLVFCNLEYLQKVRGMIDPETNDRAVTAIQIKLKDFKDAPEVVSRLRAIFPASQFSVRTWEQKQGPLLAAVEIESAILNVLLFLIIAVAGFGILAIFYMIVVEKTRDIGILKALGASSSGVMTIFLSYGLSLGIVGSGAGVAAGLLFVHYINEIEVALTWLTGHKVFDERIYYFPSIPTAVNPVTVLWVAAGAIAIAVLAAILPARRAARLHPVRALRFE